MSRSSRKGGGRRSGGPVRTAWLGGAIGALFCLVGTLAAAEEPARAGWEFSITPYLWATSLNGDLTLRGRSFDVDASFDDILTASDSIIGIEGHGEAWHGDWGLYVDGIYNRIEVEDAVRSIINIDMVTEISIVEAGFLYRIGEWPLASGWSGTGPDAPMLQLDGYAGARYTSLDVKNKVTIGGLTLKESGDQNWVDPILGARAILSLDERWQLMVGGDIGGFGAGSDVSWSALGLVGYRYELLGVNLTSVFGYKALYQDFENGSGGRRFEWDMTLHGPIVGTIVRF